ncbi:MAG: hypothetical protein JXJ20_00370 [Anaerolineae bacterium]|jgi:hypothetical protein|nr:hypothetical protein [Anaerolineae bacterium]
MTERGTRLLATLIIWGGFTAVMGILAGTVSASNMELDYVGGGILAVIVIFLIAAVMRSTNAIWSGMFTEYETFAKPKRTGRRRAERLIEMLDDDDLYDLETLLLERQEKESSVRRQE